MRVMQVVSAPSRLSDRRGAVRRATSGELDGRTECSSAITVPRETVAERALNPAPASRSRMLASPSQDASPSAHTCRADSSGRQVGRMSGSARDPEVIAGRTQRKYPPRQAPGLVHANGASGAGGREASRDADCIATVELRGCASLIATPCGPPRCGDVKPSPRSEDMRRPVPPAARAQTRGMAERSGIRARGPWARCGGHARDGAAVDARRSGCGGVRISPCPESRKGGGRRPPAPRGRGTSFT